MLAGQMIYTTSSGDVITAGSQKDLPTKSSRLRYFRHSGTKYCRCSTHKFGTGGNGSTSTGPLIVTTSARNAVQQLSQHNSNNWSVRRHKQIVWRQIGSTNVTTNPAGMLTGTANTDGTVAGTGNKIVWTSRPAQKRQLNGPESTDHLQANSYHAFGGTNGKEFFH
ncbi:hypothetical protein CVS40_2969 [Lucilia cuprina]|nr:hypothetical protein CVS40_2969 [Lucilia cuprina]